LKQAIRIAALSLGLLLGNAQIEARTPAAPAGPAPSSAPAEPTLAEPTPGEPASVEEPTASTTSSINIGFTAGIIVVVVIFGFVLILRKNAGESEGDAS
jgi:hypothetical protein